MNNIPLKNSIYKITKKKTLPFDNNSDVTVKSGQILFTSINHAMNNLVHNDMYTERYLNYQGSSSTGPKQYSMENIETAPDNTKMWGNNSTHDMGFYIYHKQVRSVRRSSDFIENPETGGTGLVNAHCVTTVFESTLIGTDIGTFRSIDRYTWQKIPQITGECYCFYNDQTQFEFLAATSEGIFRINNYSTLGNDGDVSTIEVQKIYDSVGQVNSIDKIGNKFYFSTNSGLTTINFQSSKVKRNDVMTGRFGSVAPTDSDDVVLAAGGSGIYKISPTFGFDEIKVIDGERKYTCQCDEYFGTDNGVFVSEGESTKRVFPQITSYVNHIHTHESDVYVAAKDGLYKNGSPFKEGGNDVKCVFSIGDSIAWSVGKQIRTNTPRTIELGGEINSCATMTNGNVVLAYGIGMCILKSDKYIGYSKTPHGIDVANNGIYSNEGRLKYILATDGIYDYDTKAKYEGTSGKNVKSMLIYGQYYVYSTGNSIFVCDQDFNIKNTIQSENADSMMQYEDHVIFKDSYGIRYADIGTLLSARDALDIPMADIDTTNAIGMKLGKVPFVVWPLSSAQLGFETQSVATKQTGGPSVSKHLYQNKRYVFSLDGTENIKYSELQYHLGSNIRNFNVDGTDGGISSILVWENSAMVAADDKVYLGRVNYSGSNIDRIVASTPIPQISSFQSMCMCERQYNLDMYKTLRTTFVSTKDEMYRNSDEITMVSSSYKGSILSAEQYEVTKNGTIYAFDKNGISSLWFSTGRTDEISAIYGVSISGIQETYDVQEGTTTYIVASTQDGASLIKQQNPNGFTLVGKVKELEGNVLGYSHYNKENEFHNLFVTSTSEGKTRFYHYKCKPQDLTSTTPEYKDTDFNTLRHFTCGSDEKVYFTDDNGLKQMEKWDSGSTETLSSGDFGHVVHCGNTYLDGTRTTIIAVFDDKDAGVMIFDATNISSICQNDGPDNTVAGIQPTVGNGNEIYVYMHGEVDSLYTMQTDYSECSTSDDVREISKYRKSTGTSTAIKSSRQFKIGDKISFVSDGKIQSEEIVNDGEFHKIDGFGPSIDMCTDAKQQKLYTLKNDRNVYENSIYDDTQSESPIYEGYDRISYSDATETMLLTDSENGVIRKNYGYQKYEEYNVGIDILGSVMSKEKVIANGKDGYTYVVESENVLKETGKWKYETTSGLEVFDVKEGDLNIYAADSKNLYAIDKGSITKIGELNGISFIKAVEYTRHILNTSDGKMYEYTYTDGFRELDSLGKINVKCMYNDSIIGADMTYDVVISYQDTIGISQRDEQAGFDYKDAKTVGEYTYLNNGNDTYKMVGTKHMKYWEMCDGVQRQVNGVYGYSGNTNLVRSSENYYMSGMKIRNFQSKINDSTRNKMILTDNGLMYVGNVGKTDSSELLFDLYEPYVIRRMSSGKYAIGSGNALQEYDYKTRDDKIIHYGKTTLFYEYSSYNTLDNSYEPTYVYGGGAYAYRSRNGFENEEYILMFGVIDGQVNGIASNGDYDFTFATNKGLMVARYMYDLHNDFNVKTYQEIDSVVSSLTHEYLDDRHIPQRHGDDSAITYINKNKIDTEIRDTSGIIRNDEIVNVVDSVDFGDDTEYIRVYSCDNDGKDDYQEVQDITYQNRHFLKENKYLGGVHNELYIRIPTVNCTYLGKEKKIMVKLDERMFKIQKIVTAMINGTSLPTQIIPDTEHQDHGCEGRFNGRILQSYSCGTDVTLRGGYYEMTFVCSGTDEQSIMIRYQS